MACLASPLLTPPQASQHSPLLSPSSTAPFTCRVIHSFFGLISPFGPNLNSARVADARLSC